MGHAGLYLPRHLQRYIQVVPGHHKPKTIMIYKHVSTGKIQDMVNPFDELVEDELKKLRDKRTLISTKNTIIPENITG
jgi:hypothetical protein